MMSNKQTAVEWLEEQINLTFYVAEASEINKRFEIVFRKAKQMEKEQHSETWKRGSYSLLEHRSGKDFEQYYNETYANDTTTGLPEEDSKRRAWHY
jgi:hypothetical protein